MKSTARTVAAYLESLPADRRAALEPVREVILANLPEGYEESVASGLIAYEVPLRVYPDTYNKKPLMYAALASQKNHMAVYLCNVYGLPGLRAQFVARWAESGKKLDMGSACVRFRKLEDIALDPIGWAVAATPMADFIRHHEAIHPAKPKKPRSSAK